jgi:hypothetical protein
MKNSNSWQQFIYSVLVLLLLPLMPLVIEFWLTGKVDEKTFAISAAMYAITVGVATKHLALLGVSIIVTVLFSSVFGYLAAGNSPYYSTAIPSVISILSFLSIHAAERYWRHVKGSELFVDFGGKDD